MSSVRSSASASLRNAVKSRRITPLATRQASSSKGQGTPVESSPVVLPEIRLGATHTSRYHEHYQSTLAPDLMYMTYDHRVARAKHPDPEAREPMTPYRANATVNQRTPPPHPRTITPDLVPELESIIIHIMVKEATASKHNLLSGIMALRALSGEAAHGGNKRGASGVQIVRAKVGAASWKLRAGMPIAAKVEIKGEAMYDFVQTLVDFVIPRIRDYPGIPLPPDGKSTKSPSVVGGVFQFGLSPSAMAFFPQIEANIDAYPRQHGMHIYFKTNQKGPRAETTARVLMSAFRLPFYRKL